MDDAPPPSESKTDNKTVWIEHLKVRMEEGKEEKFIMLKNLIHGWKQPQIMDIKVGSKEKASNVKFAKTTSNEYCFRINGMQTYF